MIKRTTIFFILAVVAANAQDEAPFRGRAAKTPKGNGKQSEDEAMSVAAVDAKAFKGDSKSNEDEMSMAKAFKGKSAKSEMSMAKAFKGKSGKTAKSTDETGSSDTGSHDTEDNLFSGKGSSNDAASTEEEAAESTSDASEDSNASGDSAASGDAAIEDAATDGSKAGDAATEELVDRLQNTNGEEGEDAEEEADSRSVGVLSNSSTNLRVGLGMTTVSIIGSIILF